MLPLDGGVYLQQPTISRKNIEQWRKNTYKLCTRTSKLVANRSNKWIRNTTKNSVAVDHKINNDRIGGYRGGR